MNFCEFFVIFTAVKRSAKYQKKSGNKLCRGFPPRHSYSHDQMVIAMPRVSPSAQLPPRFFFQFFLCSAEPRAPLWKPPMPRVSPSAKLPSMPRVSPSAQPVTAVRCRCCRLYLCRRCLCRGAREAVGIAPAMPRGGGYAEGFLGLPDATFARGAAPRVPLGRDLCRGG